MNMENCFKPNHPESMEYQLRARKSDYSKGVYGFSYIRESLVNTAEKLNAPLWQEAKAWNEKILQEFPAAKC